jgi:hypothetical protein
MSLEMNYLRRTSIGAGVGTAGRIGKLLGEDCELSDNGSC